ncbi:MAG: flagellar biosynthesis protein FlhA [Planctomycetes bacterium]|nr:flagellar biosynthesis protein FlhA [Planctomycetota bacterium]
MPDLTLNLRRAVRRSPDVILIMAAILTIFMTLVIPLPTFIMDVLLVINMTAAFVLLLGTVFLEDPLGLSTFPSLLLILTFYRLTLNVATTRLILSSSSASTDKAGLMIQAFGQIVAGRDEVVGMVIFVILIVIQFVVITKGATRISEVAARFTLDAMPGKQMSIDADLNSGLISEDEARARRSRLEKETDFYGAMDGASKWVRGDAIAGLIITLVNIIGGFVIGIVKQGLSPGEAIATYTRLTVGDGLVSQVPALVISVAAGLIITRSAGRENLGRQVLSELFVGWRPIGAAGVILAVLGLAVFPPLQALPVAAVLLAAAWFMRRREIERRSARLAEEERRARPGGPEPVDHLLQVDAVELEIGYGMIPLVDPKQGGELLERIGAMRRQSATDLGIVIPPVRIRDNLALGPNEYSISVRGERVASGEVRPGKLMAMDTGAASGPVPGAESAREPAFDTPACWILPADRDRAVASGYLVVDPTTVIATHLSEILKKNAADLLTRDETGRLLDRLKETSPRLVEDALKLLSIAQIQEVLGRLLSEGVSIRNLELIVEAVTSVAHRTTDPEILAEYSRNSLARTISRSLASSDGKLYVITVDPRIEDLVRDSLETTETGTQVGLPPERLKALAQAMRSAAEEAAGSGHVPVFITSSPARPHLARIASQAVPESSVIAYNEVAREVDVESVGTLALQASEAAA